MSIDEAIAAYEAVALEVIAANLAKAEREGANVDPFYKYRLGEGRITGWYEKQVVEELLRLPPAASYHDVGAGIGTIPILMGLLGHRGVGIDWIESRSKLGREIVATLEKDWPGLSRRVTMVTGNAPAIFAEIDTDGALCVSTNIGAERPEAEIEDYLAAVRRLYVGYLFDLALLWGIHREPEQRMRELDRVRRAFGVEPVLIHELPSFAYYYFADFRAP